MEMQLYDPRECATFRRSAERYGLLSNMAGRMPLRAGGMAFQSSEGLYQALKFPHSPEAQRIIGRAKNGFAAKIVAYEVEETLTPGWDDIKLDAMRFALAVKLAQHPGTFGKTLRQTRNLPIVESSRDDDYWGAIPRTAGLIGHNHLGKLLTELRTELYQTDDEREASIIMAGRIETDRLAINGTPALARHRASAANQEDWTEPRAAPAARQN